MAALPAQVEHLAHQVAAEQVGEQALPGAVVDQVQQVAQHQQRLAAPGDPGQGGVVAVNVGDQQHQGTLPPPARRAGFSGQGQGDLLRHRRIGLAGAGLLQRRPGGRAPQPAQGPGGVGPQQRVGAGQEPGGALPPPLAPPELPRATRALRRRYRGCRPGR